MTNTLSEYGIGVEGEAVQVNGRLVPTTLPEQRLLMLQLINAERERVGLDPVELGSNPAAQMHAETMVEHCFTAHWGMDGLKPYMRYSLAGGSQSNGENVIGQIHCKGLLAWAIAFRSLEGKVANAVEELMESPGHRRTILDHTHRRVNIGLAWHASNFVVVQHFEGDYVEYKELPSIVGDSLDLTGELKNGARADDEFDLRVYITYDQPPQSLTRGQLFLTNCYGSGKLVAYLRPPLALGRSYSSDEATHEFKRCPDPYAFSADANSPDSIQAADALRAASYQIRRILPPETITFPLITADSWDLEGETFSISANIEEILARHGPGVYTIVVLAMVDGETEVVVSESSIFYEISPPEGYSS